MMKHARFEGGEVSQLTEPMANLTKRLWIKNCSKLTWLAGRMVIIFIFDS